MHLMQRVLQAGWVAATVWAMGTSAACEKARSGQPPNPTSPKDSRVLLADAGNDGPEPTVPPPSPTVKVNSKGDCKVDYAPRPTRDPNPVCKIAGGSFMMGSTDPKAAVNEKPVRKVTITPYFIDQFEVTNAQVAHFLNAVGNRCAGAASDKCFRINTISNGAPYLSEADGRFNVRPGFEHHPVYSATVAGAERYCAWVGKRLPTEAQWEFAARHDPKTQQDYRWPWGDKFLPKRAACDEAVCKDGFENTVKIENSSDEAPVGTFDGTHGFGDGSSPWGVHDMAGNVSEIMADFFTEPYPSCGACTDPVVLASSDPTQKNYRSIRGFHAQADSLRSSLRYGGSSFEGFRCAYR